MDHNGVIHLYSELRISEERPSVFIVWGIGQGRLLDSDCPTLLLLLLLFDVVLSEQYVTIYEKKGFHRNKKNKRKCTKIYYLYCVFGALLFKVPDYYYFFFIREYLLKFLCKQQRPDVTRLKAL